MKKKKMPLWGVILLAALYLIFGMNPQVSEPAESDQPTASMVVEVTEALSEERLDPDGSYTSKEEVALYIHTYGCLPDNFISKNEARDLGWEGGGLEDYAPGKCIGGDRFGNYEGLLPDAP